MLTIEREGNYAAMEKDLSPEAIELILQVSDFLRECHASAIPPSFSI